MKKILVVGGAGYIGSVVVNQLVELGYKVTVIDNLSTGFKSFINKKAKFFKIDINNLKKLKNFFSTNNYDAVFHFAALINIKESAKNPSKYYRVNVDGTDNLLNCASKKKIKYFIFSSTCAVYGVLANKKVDELNPTIPISNYAKTKLLSEVLIKNYAKKFSMKYAILRYFNVIGVDSNLQSGEVHEGHLLKNITHNINKNKYSINLFGKNHPTKDGTAIRDYIDVNDLSSIHIMSLRKLANSKSFILNCGYNFGYSVLDIIKITENLIKKKIKINILPRIKGDISEIYSNNSKLKSFFPHWKRKFSIKDSILNALEWEKSLKLKKITEKSIYK